MKKILLLLLAFTLLHACTDSSTNKEEKQDTTTIKDTNTNLSVENRAEEQVNLKWKINRGEDEDLNPVADIYLKVNGKKFTIEEKVIGPFGEVPKDRYDTQNIPDDALTACGSFWAGLMQTFYVKKNENKIEVYKIYQDEGQSPTSPKKIKTIDL